MNNLSLTGSRIVAMEDKAIAKVYKLENFLSDLPSTDIKTSHIIHGGMYSRTIKVPSGTVVCGALMKVPTILIAQGDVVFFMDDKATELHGYNVFAASANRKQAVVTLSETYFTMIFSTDAKTIEEAENQFTDDADTLLSRKQPENNTIIITGE